MEAMLRMIDTPETVTGPINIGNPRRIHHMGIGELVIELTGTKAKLYSSR